MPMPLLLPSSRIARMLTVGALAAATAALMALAGPSPARAAPVTVTSWDALTDALGDPGSDLVTLGGSLSESGGVLSVTGTHTLDLSSYELDVQSVDVTDGASLTIQSTGGQGILTADASASGASLSGIQLDNPSSSVTIASGTVNATGAGYGGPGIGPTGNWSGGNITISGGDVTAIGGVNAAGIGSAAYGTIGVIAISGGTVNATGGSLSAGIGAGFHSTATSVSFTGGATTAVAGDHAAAIGGGMGGAGTAVTIGKDARVTAAASTLASTAIGAGNGGSDFGSLEIDGVLTIPCGTAWSIPSSFTVSGTGLIDQRGSVRADDIAEIEPAIVSHDLMFLPNGGSGTTQTVGLCGDSIDASSGTQTPTLSRDHYAFNGWNTAADGSGSTFTSATDVPPGGMTVYAQWTPTPVELVFAPTAPGQLVAGSAGSFTVTALDENGDVIPGQAGIHLGSSDGSDHVADNGDGVFSVTATHAGPRALTASLDGTDLSATDNVTVLPAAPVAIALTVKPATVTQGDHVTATVVGADPYGNAIAAAELPGTVTLSSDHSTDEINGMTITFRHASTHTITATLTDGATSLTTSTVVTVHPAPVTVASVESPGLADTGSDTAPAGILALMLFALGALAVGIGVVASRLRRRERTAGR